MYNKGKIKVQSSAKQTTSPWSKDVLTDPAGQWKFPGQVTKVPTTSGAITMRGVSNPVLGIDNLGNQQMMYPGMDYHFPGNMVTEIPMAQKGGPFKPVLPKEKSFEDNVNYYLGYPMTKAKIIGEMSAGKDNDAVDNIRHPLAGMFTTQALMNKGLDPLTAFMGANALGIGHEITSPNTEDGMSWWNTIREGAEDVFNNMVGAGIGIMPGLTDAERIQMIQRLSYANKLPDGYDIPQIQGQPKHNMYFKQFGGELELDEDQVEQYRRNGFVVEELPKVQLGYNTPEYNQAYNQGIVTRYNPETDTYQGQDLPTFELTGKDERLRSAIRKGQQDFLLGALDATSAPQKAAVEMFTGKQQFPSEAWGFDTTNVPWYHPKSISNFAMDALTDPLDLIGVGLAGDIGKAIKYAKPSLTPKFKSEINWAKWNKETPNYPELINEYNAIEESTKKAGNWMKYSDNTPFTGTPEQFIQQQSSHFKKAFPNVLRDEAGNIRKTYHGSPRSFDVFDPTFQKRGNFGKGIYTSLSKDEAKFYTKNFDNIDDYNPFLGELYQNVENPIVPDDFIYNQQMVAKKKYEDLLLEKGAFGKDADEAFVQYQKELDNVKNLVHSDEFAKRNRIAGDIIAVPYTNYPKSAVGNVGFFDMTNPNIYKSIVPTVIGAGALQEKKYGGELELTDEEVEEYRRGGFIVEELPMAQVGYNTPEYNKAYKKGWVTKYIPETDTYQGQDLPEFELTEKDTRVADAVRKGRDEFATDYMVPAIKTAASFTPMGPLIGLTDAAYALSQGDTFGGVLGAGMEALPYGIGKSAKALSKFKNIGRAANTEPNIIRHVLEDPNKKSTLKKIGDKLSDAKIFPSLNIKHLPKNISFENNMYSVVAKGPKGERVAYLNLSPEYHITGYKKPDGTFHAKNDVIDRMMNDSQYHQQWMDRLTTIEEKGDWLKPAMIKVDKNLWGNQMQDVLYQKGIELAKSQGFKGVRSGDILLSPSKTKKAHERFMGEALGENMTSGVRHQIKGLTGHVNPNVEKEFLDRYAKLNKLQINPGFKKFSDLSNPSQFLYGLAATSPLAGYGALKAIDGINYLANKMQDDKRMTSLPNKQFGGAYDILELSDEEVKELKRQGYIIENV